MISSLRNFAKTKLAGIFIFIIIIPFVFWGMGSVFNSGNTNNIAKVNNTNISTQDFMNYLNQSGLSQQVIKENINKNIIEELLSALISTTLLDLEIKNLDLQISEEIIAEKLKRNKNFLDDNGNFQRTLYEKFLLTNNITAPMYEIKLKNNNLQKKLFTYLSGGSKHPVFLVNKYFRENNKKLDIEFINLNQFYKKINDFTDKEIQIFIEENSDKLKQDYIDFSYVFLKPKDLIGLDEFNKNFFDKIDDIENKISKNVDFKDIVDEIKIKPIITKNYINLENKKIIENIIYNSKKNKIEILEFEGSYVLYQIDRIISKLPEFNNNDFKNQIKNLLFQKDKFEYNKKILDQIKNKKFNQMSFDNFGKINVKKIKINSINDNQTFEKKSIEVLYSLPLNAFTLISDDKENIFIAKIIKYEIENISEKSDKFNTISNEANAQNRNSMLKSYDYFLNKKYKITINKKTIDRVKNYFK